VSGVIEVVSGKSGFFPRTGMAPDAAVVVLYALLLLWCDGVGDGPVSGASVRRFGRGIDDCVAVWRTGGGGTGGELDTSGIVQLKRSLCVDDSPGLGPPAGPENGTRPETGSGDVPSVSPAKSAVGGETDKLEARGSCVAGVLAGRLMSLIRSGLGGDGTTSILSGLGGGGSRPGLLLPGMLVGTLGRDIRNESAESPAGASPLGPLVPLT
jgi:hypothetical protein